MESNIWDTNIFVLIKTGGPIMVPIMLCSFFALAIIIDKSIYFCMIKTNSFALKKRVIDLLKDNKLKEAISVCESDKSPVAKVLKAGLLKFGSSKEQIKENIEEISLFEIPKLESKLGALATIAHITPLLGLLGTVTGMTASFHTIQVRAASFNPVTPGDLAGGIGEALLTTVAGLVIAIPSFVAYNYFLSRVDSIVLDMEVFSTELTNAMGQITHTRA